MEQNEVVTDRIRSSTSETTLPQEWHQQEWEAQGIIRLKIATQGDARGTADHDSLRVDQMELSGPMIRVRTKKLKESMQALVRTIHDGVDLANVTRELEKDEATHYTLVQVVEPNEEELGASFEV